MDLVSWPKSKKEKKLQVFTNTDIQRIDPLNPKTTTDWVQIKETKSKLTHKFPSPLWPYFTLPFLVQPPLDTCHSNTKTLIFFIYSTEKLLKKLLTVRTKISFDQIYFFFDQMTKAIIILINTSKPTFLSFLLQNIFHILSQKKYIPYFLGPKTQTMLTSYSFPTNFTVH